MRYILTKDNILYDLESKKISSVEYLHTEEQLKEYGLEEPCYMVYYYSEDEGQHLERDGKGGRSMDNFDDSEILKQSDVIEELFDEIVIDCKNNINKKPFIHILPPKVYVTKTRIDYTTEQYTSVYGAIWTTKGLKYVAKMNKQGKFEIIEEK